MAMMGVLKELHQLPKLKLNLKFEVEVLCKTLHLEVGQIPSSNLLSSIAQVPEGAMSANPVGVRIMSLGESLPAAGSVGGVGGSGSGSGTDVFSAGPSFPLLAAGNIGSIRQYVSIGDASGPNKIVLLQEGDASLKAAVPAALERAIEEIINPVVERSIKIACISCFKLVSKDFVFEPNEQKVGSAAHMMVQHLAGSLAMVTAKEPARVSIGNHLRQLLTAATAQQADAGKPSAPQLQLIDQAVQIAVNLNLDLVCSYIEKSAMERAVAAVDAELSDEYQDRRRYHESQPTQPYHSKLYRNEFQQLPSFLRPQVGGLSPQQFSLYENFNNVSSDGDGAATAAAVAAGDGDATSAPTSAAEPQPGTPERASGPAPGHMATPLQGQGSGGSSPQAAVGARPPPSPSPLQPPQPPQAPRSPAGQGNGHPMAAIDTLMGELEAAIARCTTGTELGGLPANHELLLVRQKVQAAVAQTGGEVVARLANKMVGALFNGEAPHLALRRDVYLNLLMQFNEVGAHRGMTMRAATKAYVFMEGPRKFEPAMVAKLLMCRLLIATDLDAYLVKAMSGSVTQVWSLAGYSSVHGFILLAT
jgi:CCR4-NOT transcription complex subunit 1